MRTIRIDHCFHVQNKISIPVVCARGCRHDFSWRSQQPQTPHGRVGSHWLCHCAASCGTLLPSDMSDGESTQPDRCYERAGGDCGRVCTQLAARNALRMYLVWFQAMVEVDARAISRAHDRQRAKVPWAHAACESVGASWLLRRAMGMKCQQAFMAGCMRAGTPHAP